MPFGAPLDTSLASTLSLVQPKAAANISTEKVTWIKSVHACSITQPPAWRAINSKGKQLITFSIVESVKVVAYDDKVPGTVAMREPLTQHRTCRTCWSCSAQSHARFACLCVTGMSHPRQAELDGAAELTAVLTSKRLIDGIMTHACVAAPDAAIVSLVPGQSHKLAFVPPAHAFPLCHYKASHADVVFGLSLGDRWCRPKPSSRFAVSTR